MADFIGLLNEPAGPAARQRIPVIGYAQAGAEGYFDDAGYPVGSGWDEVLFPDIGDPHAYAVEVSGDSMLPMYRDGDVLVVSPQAAENVRRGDRVVVRTTAGEVMVKELARISANRIELKSLNAEHPDRMLKRDEVAWIARVVWVSQ